VDTVFYVRMAQFALQSLHKPQTPFSASPLACGLTESEFRGTRQQTKRKALESTRFDRMTNTKKHFLVWRGLLLTRKKTQTYLRKLFKMNEHEIEIIAERMQDRLDKRFMNSDMTQAQYDQESREIAAWVEKTLELVKWHSCKI
jgi:hypothetical protein